MGYEGYAGWPDPVGRAAGAYDDGFAGTRAGVVWMIVARRPHPGTVYLGWDYLPTFYLYANVQGITDRASAERIALDIIGPDGIIIDARRV